MSLARGLVATDDISTIAFVERVEALRVCLSKCRRFIDPEFDYSGRCLYSRISSAVIDSGGASL